MQINVWVLIVSVVSALVIGGVSATVFMPAPAPEKIMVPQECKPASTENFRRGVKPENTGRNKEY